ncbi:hypothetical protein AX16_005929 [Volvariella volvacea WC 439]|nr:hypothetical protein AX16_008510 [Volvariella volvacea WC 439]KAF8649221.1 hypothetical protein AX16_005929 [Volvariella volvacea WC 439]
MASAAATTKQWESRKPSLPPLALPDPPAHFQDDIPDRFSDDDSIDETPEYDLNLGAESPMDDEPFGRSYACPSPHPWAKLGAVAQPRQSTWTSSLSGQRKSLGARRTVADRDCGICFEVAVSPTRVLCCGKLFCGEHISDWLSGSASNGRCPCCEAPCSLERNTMSLAPPTLNLQNYRDLKQPKPLRPSERPHVLLFDQQIKEGNISRPPSVSRFQSQSQSRSRSPASSPTSSSSSSSSLHSSSTSITSVSSSSWTCSSKPLHPPPYSPLHLSPAPRYTNSNSNSLSPHSHLHSNAHQPPVADTNGSETADSRTHSPLLGPFFATTYSPSSPLPSAWAAAAVGALVNAAGLSKAYSGDSAGEDVGGGYGYGQGQGQGYGQGQGQSVEVGVGGGGMGIGREVNVITSKILSIVGLTLVFYILLS